MPMLVCVGDVFESRRHRSKLEKYLSEFDIILLRFSSIKNMMNNYLAEDLLSSLAVGGLADASTLGILYQYRDVARCVGWGSLFHWICCVVLCHGHVGSVELSYKRGNRWWRAQSVD